jgi:hypothetical protein
MSSPYKNKPESEWKRITKDLVKRYPLSINDIVEAVLKAWEGILSTKIAGELQIGIDILPSPQIMGNYLHELIPIMLERKYPGKWSRDIKKDDKDLVYLLDDSFSTEIKTSSNPNNIYGNASYGQEDSSSASSKTKDGYYIGVNFEKFDQAAPGEKPKIRKIRIGWLDHEDWHSQAASSGQAATITATVRDNKLLLIYDVSRGGILPIQ